MTTTGYEVHVIRDRRWVVAERFGNDSREEAISAAKRIFNTEKVDGVRVFTERFDIASQLFVPQFVMREVRPGVKTARDAPVQAPAPVRARAPSAAPSTVAAQAALNDPVPTSTSTPAAARPIAVPGGFDPDHYLASVSQGGLAGAPPSDVPRSKLQDAGKRAFETALLIAGLLMEGIGFAMLLALLDNSDASWSERPFWVTIAFGLLLVGLLIVVRQIKRLRALGNWLTMPVDELDVYRAPFEARETKPSGFRWRTLLDAVLFNRMPSKWPEPEQSPLPVSQPSPAQTNETAAPAAETEREPDPAALDQVIGFIEKYLHGDDFQAVADQLMDDDSRFGACLFLRGGVNACVEAARLSTRRPGLLLNVAFAPLQLSPETLHDYALRYEIFEQDTRVLAMIDRGRETMTRALENRQADSAAVLDAVQEWSQRRILPNSDRVYVLAIDARLAIGSIPPEPSVVAHAFEEHRAMIGVIADIYRGRATSLANVLLFQSASDAAAAAMEIQARRLGVSLEDGAVPIDVRTVVGDFALAQLEIGNVAMVLGDVQRLAEKAVPGEVMVAESMRTALIGVGYTLRETRTVEVLDGQSVQLAAVEWKGAPAISLAS